MLLLQYLHTPTFGKMEMIEIEPVMKPMDGLCLLVLFREQDTKTIFSQRKILFVWLWRMFQSIENIILKWNGWSEKKRIKNGLKRAKVFNSVPLWSFALNNVKHTVHKIINKHLCETHSAQKSSTMEKKWVSRPTDDQLIAQLNCFKFG